MKLAVFNPVLGERDLEESLAYLSKLGVTAMEMGCGGYPGKQQINPKDYLGNPKACQELLDLFSKYNMELATLSVHGNPVHPNKEEADRFHNDYVDACNLARELNVKTLVTFSGCPGGSIVDTTPNWVTCFWPDEFSRVLKWQWEEVLVPYWKEAVKLAEECDVNLAFEMHPGFCVYNTHTALKLREMVGSDRIGVNFDPSHLFWQGMDPVVSIKELKGCIYHFHAKDTYLDKINIAKNGVLDTSDYGDLDNRSWYFQTVGYGSDKLVWKQMMSALRKAGYDGPISIEHEDSLMSVEEGLDKAIKFLDGLILKEDLPNAWWF